MMTPCTRLEAPLCRLAAIVLVALVGCGADEGAPPDAPPTLDAAGLPKCEPPAPCALVVVDSRRLEAVLVDGQPADGSPVRVEPGQHEVVVEAAGRPAVHLQVVVGAGQELPGAVPLPPPLSTARP